MPKCIVIDGSESGGAGGAGFDWEGDRPLNRPLRDCVIYETHVRGLTAPTPRSACEHPGTFRGVVEKIPYLKELGVTAVELLPVQEFDEHENPIGTNPLTGERLGELLGLQHHRLLRPQGQLRRRPAARGSRCSEFREMVRELHQAGIEVILDVVFNHTAEGDETGPDALLPRPRQRDLLHARRATGAATRTTRAAATPSTATTRWCATSSSTACATGWWRCTWTASASTWPPSWAATRRGDCWRTRPSWSGSPRTRCCATPRSSPRPGTPAGAYQVGWFPGGRWAEWNGRFRDDVRRFWRGDPGMVPRAGHAADRQLRPLPARRPQARSTASTSSPATTASPSTTW